MPHWLKGLFKRLSLRALIGAQFLVIVGFAALFLIVEADQTGRVETTYFSKRAASILSYANGLMTDAKFRSRGKRPLRAPIVVVAIDEVSLESAGRWPWRRDQVAQLVNNIFEEGARVVALDIVFAEPDPRIPEDLKPVLEKANVLKTALTYETDPLFEKLVLQDRERLVLGWTSDSPCIPLRAEHPDDCPVMNPEALALIPPSFQRFALAPTSAFPLDHTSLMSFVTLIPNYEKISYAGAHAGYFNAFPDVDATIRRTRLVSVVGGRLHPSLALDAASLYADREIEAQMSPAGELEDLRFKDDAQPLSVTPDGTFAIDFVGPGWSFPRVSAIDLLDRSSNEVATGPNDSDKRPRREVFKDALVFVGATALGLLDSRAFPTDKIVPGVEGHATIAENLITRGGLHTFHKGPVRNALLFVMTVGAALLAAFLIRVESVTAIGTILAALGALYYLDFRVAFAHGYDLPSALVYAEFLVLFGLTQTVRYVLAERERRFVKDAFGRYVSPKIVDRLIDDPSLMQLGGERRELSVLFSDIHGFTELSETMDPRRLAAFLNEYLSLMTQVVVDECDGTLDKYIGDAIMCFWGAPVDETRHAQLACRAALRMQAVNEQHREAIRAKYGVSVKFGVGIATGSVSVGNMGSERAFNYTAIGDRVNLSSRLEGLTRHYGVSILTTRETLQQAGTLPYRVVDEVRVKGKREVIELIELFTRPMSDEGLQRYNEARALYRNGAFSEAADAFTQAAAQLAGPAGHDAASILLAERCATLALMPPEGEWTGVWDMKEK